MSADFLARAVLQQRLSDARQELELRLRRGERQVAEQILAEHEDFAADDEWALELIYAEYATLDELGQPPSAEQLCRRFPRWISVPTDGCLSRAATAASSSSGR